MIQFEITLLGNLQRCAQRFGIILEELLHFGRRLKVELLRVETQAVRIRDVGGRADAQEHVMRFRVLAL